MSSLKKQSAPQLHIRRTTYLNPSRTQRMNTIIKIVALFTLFSILNGDLLLQHTDVEKIHHFATLHGLPDPTHVHGNYYAIPTLTHASELLYKASLHNIVIEQADPLPFSYGALLHFRPPKHGKTYAGRELLLEDEKSDAGWEIPLTPNNGIHLNLTGLAERGIDGRGVTVSILDDGVDSLHSTFHLTKPNACSYSVCGNPSDGGIPQTPVDTHGTACAALAVGRDGCVGRGSAPAATLCSVRVLCATAPTVIQLARGYAANNDDIHGSVVSASFGPVDNGRTYYNLHPMVWDVLESNARNNLIHVHAAGNGYQSLDTCSADGTISNPFVIAVGAVDSSGTIAYYSEGCPSLLGVAPSSGSRALVSALPGHGRQTCTSFGGTSASAPEVAGMVALLKQVRPTISMRDVRNALIRTANREKLHATTFTRNAAGFYHSNRGGFGLFDGGAAVAYVESPSWKPLPPQIQCAAEVHSTDAVQTLNVTISNCAITFIESMWYEMIFDGNLSILKNITWLSAQGTPAQFIGTTHKYTVQNVAQSAGVWATGENPSGVWTLSWRLTSSPVRNVVNKVRLIIYGYI